MSPEQADGSKTAFGSERDGRAAVRITLIDGPEDGTRGPVTVAEADHYLGSPAWSPNGRRLYFLSEKGERTSLRARELDPRTKEPLGPDREVYVPAKARNRLNFPLGNGAIGVAADRIIFTVTETTGNIYMARPKKR